MSEKVAWIISIAIVLVAGIIGWSIYKSTQTASTAASVAATNAGSAAGASVVQQAESAIKGLLGIQ